MNEQVGHTQPTRFIFAISFKSKTVCEDWDLAQKLLGQTIHSIRNSSRKDFLIVIACHELPYFADDLDAGVIFVQAPFWPKQELVKGARDKLRKRRLIGAWIRRNVRSGGVYVMWCDADDLVHKDVVAYVLGNDNRRSYLVERGYIYDCSTTKLVRNDTHDKLCGTCFACYFQRRELPWAWFDQWSKYSQFEEHIQFRATAKAIGRHPDVIPFRAVTYLANHSESLKMRRMKRLFTYQASAVIGETEALAILGDDFSVAGEVERGQKLAVDPVAKNLISG